MRASGFLAYRFDRFAVAAGPFADFGSLQIVRALDFVDTEGKASIDTRATGFGASAAIFWRATDDFDLGLSYQSRSKLDFSGYATFVAPAEFKSIAANQALSTTMRLPDRLTLGALYLISEEVDLSADLELLLWSTMSSLVLDFTNPSTPSITEPRDWHTTIAPRIGATYGPRALSWLKVRGGAFLDPSPVPSTTVGPSSPDSTRIGLSLGASFMIFEGASLDVAYQQLFLTGASASGDTMPGVRYGGNLQLLGASLTYRFSS
jgi:long-subunit fatty acid transport protein